MVRWPLASASLLVALLAGCTDFDDPARQNHLFVQGIDVSAPQVGSGRLTLLVNTTLDNDMAPSGDLLLLVKAFDRSTGLLVEQVETATPPLRKAETRIVPTALDLPRAPGYRLEVALLQDGEMLRGGTLEVSNLDRLEPNLHDSGLRIASIDFEVLSTQGPGNRTSVRATVYLTNEGTGSSRPLSLQVKARESSTGLLAAQVWSQVGSIGLDATRPHNATFALPGGYNYDVEAVLWDGDVIVERGTGSVRFAPTAVLDPGQQVVVSRPDLGDFAHEPGAGDSGDGGESATPGLALPALAAALVAALLVLRRRS